MKKPINTLLFLLSLTAIALTPGPSVYADPAQSEVSVRKVFFPAQGYDDNDNVQIVVEGVMPDPCYVLGKQTISQDASGAFVVHQFAWRREGDVCNSGDLLGESAFSEEVSLGRLKAGDYQVAFNPDEATTDYRKLHIEAARVSAVDTFNYARVTNLKAPDVVLEGQPAQVSISGPFTSSCNQLKEPIEVKKQGDTIVILPVEVNLGDCGWVYRTFDKTINLGILPPGEYLVHVRSRNGKAVEKTFVVVGTHAGDHAK